MSDKTEYKVLAEGVARGHDLLADAAEGDVVALDIDKYVESAIVAAGWVEPVKSKKKEG